MSLPFTPLKTAALTFASLFAFALVLAYSPSLAVAQEVPEGRAQIEGEIESVTIHPFMRLPFVCSDHAVGELTELGDALGKDCLAVGAEEKEEGRRTLGFFRGDGLENEDYFGWRAPVLAPFDGVVREVDVNPKTNRPGALPSDYSPEDGAGSITFERADGVYVGYAHVREIQVEVGDTVSAGEVVAKVGNNGNSRNPHVHLGAFRGEEPLHIRFDQRALGRIRGTLEEEGDSSEDDS